MVFILRIVLLTAFIAGDSISLPITAMDRILQVNGNKDDMIRQTQTRERRALTPISSNVRWMKNNVLGTVPYVITSGFADGAMAVINDSIAAIVSNTCVRFVRYSSTDEAPSNHVSFVRGSRCSSYIGMIGGAQNLILKANVANGNFVSGCDFTSVVTHELLHALGFYHEQSRSDRDTYVRINMTNVIPGLEHNFNKEITESLGSPYDPSSIMHYSRTAFSSNGLDTMEWIFDNSNPTLGGSVLTTSDIQQINSYYCVCSVDGGGS